MPFQKNTPAIQIRGLHLDLKGTPPTFPRLLDLLDLFSAFRYNLILLEWEDMFPWSGDATFRSPDAYSSEEVKIFLAKASRLKIEIVPLIQTLGHMENFLKGSDRSSLREDLACTDVLNPLAPGASEFVKSLIQETLALMPNVKRFHLGGDEAWHLGVHPQTAEFIGKYGAAALYHHHMQPLFDLLLAKDIRPLLWHDMMTKWEDADIQKIATQADLVVWGYAGHPDTEGCHFDSRYIERFLRLGATVWGACAFKGAEGTNADRPSVDARIQNAKDWMDIALRYEFSGIISTGWSRYCFNTCQCESIEASLDTVLAHALLMHDGQLDSDAIARSPTLISDLWSKEEGERFATIRKVANQYAIAHEACWYDARMHLAHLATIHLEPKRKLSLHYQHLFERSLNSFRQAVSPYRSALSLLVSPTSLQSYFAERDNAIKGIKELRALLNVQCSPDSGDRQS